MGVVRTARLRAGAEGQAARLCEIELIDLGVGAEPRHLVNVRQGREGGALRETTRTPSPVTRGEALKLFDSVLVARLNEGFRDVSGAAPAFSATGSAARAASPAGAWPDLAQRLAEAAAGRLDPADRDKALFRAGLLADRSLGDAALAIFAGLGARDASQPLVHALARCARERGASALEAIGREATSEATRDLARYARASRWMGDVARPDPADAPALAGASDLAALAAGEARAPGSASAALIALGRRGPLDAEARRRLLDLLTAGKPVPPFLRAFRRLFKFAELGDDAELFAETARAFELQQPMFRRGGLWRGEIYWPGARKMVNAAAEIASPSPRFALSDRTSHYMRRRAWRALRKRGELGHASFTDMAGALIARFGEEDLGGGMRSIDRVRRLWSLAHLVLGEAQELEFNSETLRVRGGSSVYAPPFAALWTRDADATLRLAIGARSSLARNFAGHLLRQIPAERLAAHALALADLAGSDDSGLADAAARILEPLVGAPGASPELLAKLIDTPHAGLRRLTLLAVAARPDAPWSETAIGVAALLAAQPETVQRVEAWLGQPPAQEALGRLAGAYVEMLRAEPAEVEPERRARLETGADRLVRLANGRAFGVSPEVFARLPGHPSPAVRAAGLRLLAASGLPLDELPDDFWERGLASPDAGLRAATVSLIGSLSDAGLARRHGSIRAATFDPDHAVRLAVRPVAARAARNDPGFGEGLFGAVLPHLFQGEPSEGFAADLAALVDEALRAPREAMPADQLWRLLMAQAQGARLVSTQALAARGDETFPPRRWARLANHPVLANRERALAAFDRNEAAFRDDPVAAVGLLDTRWPETRAAALERLQRWEPGAFSVEALADLADSNDPATQADARSLLRRAIAPGSGGASLQRLFEHPAPSFHLFVTELLTNENLADGAAFAHFLDAARMILFRVEAGRAAKSRIWTRLAQEATSSRERAQAILPILLQTSLSATERDRAPALALLRDLALAWPDLATPLTLSAAPRHSPVARAS